MIKKMINQKNYRLFFILLSLLLVLPGNISAKKRTKGAHLKVISDKMITGELMEVRENSLLILVTEAGRQTVVDVDFGKIDKIMIKRKSRTGKWALYGLLIGTTAGVVFGSTQTYGILDTHGRTANAKLHGVMFGVLGLGAGVIGGTVDRSIRVKYKEIYNKEKSIHNLDEIINKLNKQARYPNPHFKTNKKQKSSSKSKRV